MKKTTYSPYATNKGGKIDAPRGVGASEPKSVAIKGDDLRAPKKGK